MELLKKLTEIRGASGDEGRIKDFLIDYVNKNKGEWTTVPELYYGDGFQDTLILVFGKPKTAIFAFLFFEILFFST